ncbi:DUF2957 domain-containing protein [Paraburkholderia sp. D15]|uniref:DUF2957 domain-containing protein n=1 Tax=Paraburkholderia sp. D15 TaxID=2880218 RepID=UPI0024798EFB|nr:DUF2957 domain-containing protein [Paraburkholderia sp. D15]WGS52399.1 DUF2957 domain-containing protein [Paraburkholderia sp. D15]WKF62198.1 hypothetical protein HUO10_006730 [Paraburkholderia busanensis]
MAFKIWAGSSASTLTGALALSVVLAACGGGKADTPGAVAVPQCSGSSCPAQGQPPSTQPVTAQLCPSSLDYSTTYTGGSGSGEYIKMQFNSATKKYQMTFVESAVPSSVGQVNVTRAGLTITGDYDNPSGAFALPTAEQNRCAIVLKNGATADGTYSVTINPADPPILFVGQGIIGGGIPGATIQFAGVTSLGFPIGVVPQRTFDSYPFLGFSETVTDFTQVAGAYNEVGFRMNPEGNPAQGTDGLTTTGWAPQAVQASETLNADGTCTPDSSPYSCTLTGAPWTLRTNADGSPDNVFISKVSPTSPNMGYPVAGVGVLQLLFSPSQAHGIMIVGKVNNQLVPVMIRVGYAHTDNNPVNILNNALDDQLGISLLAPATKVDASTGLKGGYIGANSASACALVTTIGQSPNPIYVNGQPIYAASGTCTDGSASFNPGVNYGATLFQSPAAALLNPFTSSVSSNFSLDFTQTQPGLVNVTATKALMSGSTALYNVGDTGVMVKVGPVYGLLMNGINPTFTTNDPANNIGKVNPYLSIGAFVE